MDESHTSKKSALDETDMRVKSSKEELKDLSLKHAASSKKLLEKRNEYEIIKNRLDDLISRCSKLADENIVNLNKVSDFDEEIREVEKELSAFSEELSRLTSEHAEQTKIKDGYSEPRYRKD